MFWVLSQECDTWKSPAQQSVEHSGGGLKVVTVLVLVTTGTGRRLTAWIQGPRGSKAKSFLHPSRGLRK